MPIKLRPGEIAFFPQPFVESEPNLFVITNQRIIQFGDEGLQEIPSRDINHLGRVSQRPWLLTGILLLVLGLPLLGFGVWYFFTAKGPITVPAIPNPAAAAKAVTDDPSGGGDEAPVEEPVEGEEGEAAAPAGPSEPLFKSGTQRILGIVAAVFGLLMVAGFVFAVRRRDHFVIVRGGPSVMRIKADDQIRQNQILMTVQAAQQGARPSGGTAAPQAAPAKPKVEVDDKGDPVKALQDLGAARAAGKIKDEEFQAKREVLLERLRKRG